MTICVREFAGGTKCQNQNPTWPPKPPPLMIRLELNSRFVARFDVYVWCCVICQRFLPHYRLGCTFSRSRTYYSQKSRHTNKCIHSFFVPQTVIHRQRPFLCDLTFSAFQIETVFIQDKTYRFLMFFFMLVNSHTILKHGINIF